jgi:hypothetical protein
MGDEQLQLSLEFLGEDETPIRPDLTDKILGQIWVERVRQDDKWGLQSHPMFTLLDGLTAEEAREAYALAATKMKKVNDENDQPGWDTILAEEIAEAYEQAGVDVDKVRQELVESAAVIVCIIEQIDREKEVTDGGVHEGRYDPFR